MSEYIHDISFDTRDEAIAYATSVGLDTFSVYRWGIWQPNKLRALVEWRVAVPDTVYRSRKSRDLLDEGEEL